MVYRRPSRLRPRFRAARSRRERPKNSPSSTPRAAKMLSRDDFPARTEPFAARHCITPAPHFSSISPPRGRLTRATSMPLFHFILLFINRCRRPLHIISSLVSAYRAGLLFSSHRRQDNISATAFDRQPLSSSASPRRCAITLSSPFISRRERQRPPAAMGQRHRAKPSALKEVADDDHHDTILL